MSRIMIDAFADELKDGSGKVVKDKQVLTLMRYYELIKEIRNVIKRA